MSGNVKRMYRAFKILRYVLMLLLLCPLTLMADESKVGISDKPIVPDSILQNIFQFSPFFFKLVD